MNTFENVPDGQISFINPSEAYDSPTMQNTRDLEPDKTPKEVPVAEPTLEQWKALYEVAQHIKQLAPWDLLWDKDMITLMLPGCDEPVYCSTMGRLGEAYGIGIYPGYESIRGYWRMALEQERDLSFSSFFEQNCLMCNFGDREEVTPKDREIMKALDLRFRGRNQWIYFRSMRPGCYPWHIDAKEAELLIQALQNYCMAVQYLREDKIKADFEKGETLLRFYSPEKELWLNTVTKALPIPEEAVKYLCIQDEILLTRLKSQKKSVLRLEMDLFYFPSPVQRDKKSRPYFPQMILLTDKASQALLGQYLVSLGESAEENVLNMLCNHILKFGRPNSISVHGEKMRILLKDTCEKIGVKLIENKGTPVLDNLRGDLFSFMGGSGQMF